VFELCGYVSEASGCAESIRARFTEIVEGDQWHALLHRPPGPHVIPRIDHGLRYEFGHRANHWLGSRDLFHAFGNMGGHTVDMAIGAVVDDEDLHACITFPRYAAARFFVMIASVTNLSTRAPCRLGLCYISEIYQSERGREPRRWPRGPSYAFVRSA